MPSKINLIGLTGPARCGKDTVAIELIKRGYMKDSFAAPIRSTIASLLGWTPEQLEERKDEVYEPLNCTPRRMMQTMGTEWGRDLLHPNIWMKLFHERYWNSPHPVVCSDVRFENEAAYIRKHGTLIHITRDSAINAVEAHSSEDGINLQVADYVLDNNASLAELRDSVTSLMDILRSDRYHVPPDPASLD